MSDVTAIPASPLASRPAFGSLSHVRVEPLGPRVRLNLRLRDEAGFGGVEQAFGVALPREACRFTDRDGRRALWLGPDEWLLGASGESGALVASLGGALAGIPHSLTDVSHRSTAISLSGPEAANLLNAGCPLDLSLRSFPVGMGTRTVLAKAEIVLMRVGDEAFEVDVWRSFAAYVFDFLAEAAREYA